MGRPLKIVLAGFVALAVAADAPAQQPADEQRMQAALARLQPERPGVVDAYVVVAALDADFHATVFRRDAAIARCLAP